MIDEAKAIVEKHSLELGYEIIEWGDDSSGFYAPTARKVKNDKEGKFIAINVYADGGIYIHDFTGDTEGMYIQHDGTTSLLSDLEDEPNVVQDFNGRKRKLFTEIYKQLKIEKPRKEHELFQTKNVVPCGGYVAASPISYKVGEKEYEFTIKDAVTVDFYDSFDAPCIGLQYRDNKLCKKSIKFSTFKNAFHILNHGTYDKYLGSTLGFITESFSTACEVTEAMPNAFVACTAGIKNQLGVYRYIVKNRPDIMLIAVLDKTKDGFPSEDERILKQHTKHIQLDLFDNRNNGLTDYNDYALKYGKGAVKKEIYRATMAIYPKMPEVLSYEDGVFKVISSIHGGIESVPVDQIGKKISSIMNIATQRLFCKKIGIDFNPENNKEFYEALSKKWLQDACSTVDRVPKGQGVFQDGDYIVANLAGARFKINGETESVAEMMPVSDQLYLNINGHDLAKQTLTLEEFNELRDAFTDVYGGDSLDLFYMLVGFCVQGSLAGISEHRAHVWINGLTGTGKSKIKEYLVEHLTSRVCLPTIDATPAAIDQKLSSNNGHNAVVVTLDECGDETASKAARVSGLLTLACETAVSKGLNSKIRGTASQDGKSYSRTAAFLFCSQTNSLKDPQDVARFLVYDMNDHKLDKKKLDNLNEVAERLGDKFVYTAIVAAEDYLSLYKPARNYLIDNIKAKFDVSHRIQSLSAIVAGAGALFNAINPDKPKTAEEYCVKLKSAIDKQIEYYLHKVSGDTSILDALLLTPLKVDGFDTDLREYVISRDDQDKLWKNYGIRGTKNKGLLISLKRFKVPLLFKNYSNKKVHISKDMLLNAVKYNDEVKKYPRKINGEQEWVIKIQ